MAAVAVFFGEDMPSGFDIGVLSSTTKTNKTARFAGAATKH